MKYEKPEVYTYGKDSGVEFDPGNVTIPCFQVENGMYSCLVSPGCVDQISIDNGAVC